MKIKAVLKAVPVLIFIAATGCVKNDVPVVHHDLSLPENADPVIAAQNQFALQSFKEVLKKDNSTSNKLISPFSIYLALSMAYNGAAGTTQKAMQKVLHLNNISTDQLNETNQGLITGLPIEDSRVKLNIANSIWYRNEGPQPLSPFLHTTSTFYNAQVSGAYFNNPKTVNRINSWVAEATHQKIKTILKKIKSVDVM